MNKKNIFIALHGTLCTNTFGEYEKAKPIKLAIKKVNNFFDEGHKIIIFTARFMGKSNGDINKAYELGFKFTKKQLSNWGVKYHELILGKPEYDLVIDDKSIFFDENWYENFKIK